MNILSVLLALAHILTPYTKLFPLENAFLISWAQFYCCDCYHLQLFLFLYSGPPWHLPGELMCLPVGGKQSLHLLLVPDSSTTLSQLPIEKLKSLAPMARVSTKVLCRWERAPLALLQILIKTWLVPELTLLVLSLQGRFHQDISVTPHLLIECIMKLDGIGNNMWAEQFRTTHF